MSRRASLALDLPSPKSVRPTKKTGIHRAVNAAIRTPPAPAPAEEVEECTVTDPPRPEAPSTSLPDDDVALNIARWQRSPLTYVREVLTAEPDAWQEDTLLAIGAAVEALLDGKITGEEFGKFVLKACKGPGKSCLLAWIIWWFLTCFEQPKVLCTSITEDNLTDGLWAELALWRGKSELVKGMFEQEGTRIYLRGAKDDNAKQTWFCSARTWPKDADKTKQADTLAGLHARNTLIILDEAGGIPPGVLVAALAHHSTQSEDKDGGVEVHLTLIAGNPTNLDSALGWACNEDAKNWWQKSITGDPDDPRRAPRIDKRWAQQQIDTLGRDNPWVLVNVFGQFPPIQSNKLLGPDVVRAAMQVIIPRELWHNAPRIMALDVARSLAADQSSLCRRQGHTVFQFRTYRIDDLMQLAGQVIFEFARWPADVIFVDMVGLGSGVLDRLRELRYPAIGINWGLPSADPRFADIRTESWWKGAHEIKGQNGQPRLALPGGLPELVTELCGPMLEFNDKGRMKLESKEKMKKRGVGSPDIADSLMLTYAQPVAVTREEPAAHSYQQARDRRGMVASEFDPYEER